MNRCLFYQIYEKCIHHYIQNYFEGNNLFSKSQSGFRKHDSCVSQLLSITHEIFKGFDANSSLEICGIFLDISKAFDRVWYEALIFKLRLIASQILCYVYSIVFFLNGFKEFFLNG